MMGRKVHKLYIFILFSIVILVFFAMLFKGYSYYSLRLEERSFHTDHQELKPSGFTGHGLGVAGSFFIVAGVFSYMARKKMKILSRWGTLSNWLEFHIFLCTLGPVLILYHTAFKFGGIVAVSFWSMVAVFISGIIGRFIYLHIPRTIEGRELTRGEINELRFKFLDILKEHHADEKILLLVTKTFNVPLSEGKTLIGRLVKYDIRNRALLKQVKSELKNINISDEHKGQIISLSKKEFELNKKLDMLTSVQNLFKYWHVVHLPFALIMLVIMIIHTIVAVTFGYRWIF